MSDDEEDEDYNDDKNEHDVEMAGNNLTDTRDRHLFELDYFEQSMLNATSNQNIVNTANISKLSKACDLSCFENMRYIHSSLKNCFSNTELTPQEHFSKFEDIWSNLKFLCKNPKSCDYYGSTVFHYAAADNNLELLRCLVGKDPSGVFCVDSKG